MSYIGKQPVPQSLQSRQQFTGDGSTSTFITLGGVELFEDVFLNGVRLSRVDNEYSFDGTTLTITPAPANGDTVSIILRNDHSELIALPITDSQGNNVLSESGTVVTLTTDEANVGSNALVVDSSGNVGVGTSSPAQKLHVEKDGSAVATFRTSNNDSFGGIELCGKNSSGTIQPFYLQSGPSSELKFSQGIFGTERMRIDSSGNVGVGTSSNYTNAKLHIYAVNAGGDNSLRIQNASTTSGTTTSLKFTNTTSDYAHVSLIADRDRNLIFKNTNDTVETMRIDSSGNLLVGYTSSNGSYKLQVNSQIYATSSTIATSDFNYKENITPLDGALSLVSQLNPVQFDWKEHPVHEFDRNQPTVGFIAQEVQKVLSDQPYVNSIVKSNECIIEPEEIDEEGNVIKEAVTEEFLGIAEGNLVALLTKAIQEQQALIESQQSQIDALTAKTQEQDLTIASLISRIEALETPAE